ncbi:MAG: aminoglycoside phosphotransferase family protein [Candidatus Doudnabacteria bacterium]|nr:aminoglycoside phosphotransferase family protein [Candidatus Doudnabacteria bacterium]
MEKQFYIDEIRKNYPNLKFKKIKIIDEGWNNTIVKLDNRFIFRFAKTDNLFPLKDEIRFLDYFSKFSPLEVPKYIYVPERVNFAGYKMIKGDSLEFSKYHKLSPHQQKQIQSGLAKFLNAVHSIPLKTARKFKIKNAWVFADAVKKAKKRAKIVAKKLSPGDKKKLSEYLDKLSQSRHSYVKSVMHQDFYEAHILYDFDKHKLAGIIDFSDVQIGDRAIDFRELWFYGKEFMDNIFNFYGSNDKSLRQRSWDWYIIISIDLMYYGITKEKKYWKQGYQIIKEKVSSVW